MNAFLRSFWLTFTSIAFFLVLTSYLVVQPIVGSLPAPPFPLNGKSFLSLYGEGGYPVHYLFRFGFFGMRERMQKSDVLLLGTSHVELGLSAAQLSANLSRAAGRPVHAYNLGIAYGDSLPFMEGCLVENDVRQKPVVLDLCMVKSVHLSPFAQKVEKTPRLKAYFAVLDIWFRAVDDWVLDPFLPRVAINTSIHGSIGIMPGRMMQQCIWRDWSTGDTVTGWHPLAGYFYTSSWRYFNRPFSQDDPLKLDHDHDLDFTPEMKTFLGQQGLRTVYTLIPYDGYQPETVPAYATPYIPISKDDLTFIDTHHLNAKSRAIATQRLFDGMQSSGALMPWLEALPKP